MYLLFDIGGTKTRIAFSEDGEHVGEEDTFETPKEFEAGITKIAEEAEKLTGGREITAAAGGAAGSLSRTKDRFVNAPNLPGWNHHPLAERLATAFGAPVYLENDSAVVGLGEAHYGAGQGAPIMMYLTISTGVGGARIVGGRIDQSAWGFEPGHQIIDIDRTLCTECVSGKADDIISGTATAHRFGVKAYEVEDPDAWEELARWSAVVVNNSILHWSPDVVVLGGSMIVGDPAIPIERIKAHLDRFLTVFPEKPVLKKAELADVGGLYGALVFAKQRHASDTSVKV